MERGDDGEREVMERGEGDGRIGEVMERGGDGRIGEVMERGGDGERR